MMQLFHYPILTYATFKIHRRGKYEMTKNNVSMVLVIAFSLFLFSGILEAATYYVDPNGSDSNDGSINSPWETIGWASQMLQSGDTVIVRAGIYHEHVIPPSGLEGAYITYQGEEGTIIDGTGTPFGSRGFTINNTSYLNIDGFEVRNFNHEPYDAINILGDSHHIELSNLDVHDSWNGIIMEADTHDIAINDCLVYNTRYGVGFEDSAHDIFINNVTSHSNQTSSAYGNGDGFSADRGTSNIFIKNSTAHHNLDAGYDIKTNGFECTNCRSYNNTKYGFRLWGETSNTLINALAYGNGWYPLQSLGTAIKYIYGSTFAGGNDNGYSVEGSGSNMVIRNSIFTNYSNAVFSSGASSVDEDYNLFYSITGPIGFSIGPNSINADPLFTDPLYDDYHLQAGSPCIDSGDSSAVPAGITTDFEGDPRIFPIDAPVDIGADEFIAGVCNGDLDEDGDVDGSDLAVFASGGGGSTSLNEFAENFGRTNCSLGP